MIPLYGFLQGDTIGLLVLAQPTDTAAELCAKMQAASALRVGALANPILLIAGRAVPDGVTVAELKLGPLERIDVVAGPLV
jgi:hypothetical protein